LETGGDGNDLHLACLKVFLVGTSLAGDNEREFGISVYSEISIDAERALLSLVGSAATSSQGGGGGERKGQAREKS